MLETVVSQHADQATFLWELRDMAVRQPHYVVSDLERLDGRIEANIDGIRIAGAPGWELLKEELETGGAGEVFAAARLAFESNTRSRIDTVLKIGNGSPELSRGLVSALGWMDYIEAEPHIRHLLSSVSPAMRKVGIAASA